MDDDQTDRPSDGNAPTVQLDEFLISCQKSLARAVRNAEQAGKSASEFTTGQQAIYVIDGLEFDLNAGVLTPSPEDSDRPDRVFLDFSASAERRSRVKFRVETRPMEVVQGARLEIALTSAPTDGDGWTRFRVWLVDDEGAPVPDYPVKLYFARSGSKRQSLRRPLSATTDVVGRVDFYVDLSAHDVKIVGDRKRQRVYLQGDAREYFVWALADRDDAWETAVEPPPPRPPLAIARTEDGQPKVLYTRVLQQAIGGGKRS